MIFFRDWRSFFSFGVFSFLFLFFIVTPYTAHEIKNSTPPEPRREFVRGVCLFHIIRFFSFSLGFLFYLYDIMRIKNCQYIFLNYYHKNNNFCDILDFNIISLEEIVLLW